MAENILTIIADLVRRVKRLEQTPVTRFVLPKYSAAPSSPITGEMYYNTTTNKAQVRTNSAWVDLH